MNLLFVCTGNTCRSPMAEYLFRKMLSDRELGHVKVRSAGIAPASFTRLPKEATALLGKEGVDQVDHVPRLLTDSDIAAADVILAMETFHRDAILSRFPDARGKVRLLKEYAGLSKGPPSIDDPFGGSLADYAKAMLEIKTALTEILKKVQSATGA